MVALARVALRATARAGAMRPTIAEVCEELDPLVELAERDLCVICCDRQGGYSRQELDQR